MFLEDPPPFLVASRMGDVEKAALAEEEASEERSETGRKAVEARSESI